LASADYSLHSFLTPSGQCTYAHLRIKDMAQGYAKLIVQVDAVIATIVQNLKQKMVLFKASCQNSLFHYTIRECYFYNPLIRKQITLSPSHKYNKF